MTPSLKNYESEVKCVCWRCYGVVSCRLFDKCCETIVISFVLGIPWTYISLFVKVGLFRSSTSTTATFTWHYVFLETSCARLAIIFLYLKWPHGSVGRAYPPCPCCAVRHGFEHRTLPHTFYHFYFSYFNFRIILF